MRLAVFDIDGTLVTCRSELRFSRFLWRRGLIRIGQISGFLGHMLHYLPIDGGDVAKRNKAYLAGLESRSLRRLATQFVDDELWGMRYEPAFERLEQHLDRRDIVLLLSGTLQPIADALAERLGVQHAWATVCKERDGVLLAQPPERHPFASSKRVLAATFARHHGLSLSQAYAYCDSYHDLELLGAVGHPVAVRPDRQLLALATERGWEVLRKESRAVLRRSSRA